MVAAGTSDQAQALIGARRIVVEGAVQIVDDAIDKIKAKGIPISQESAQRLVSNLLVVICADARVQPTFAIEDEANAGNQIVLQSIVAVLEEIRANTKK